MSWIEKVQSNLVITTGDGKSFTPLWVPTTKSFDFNVAEFEFPDLEGTLVRRAKAKGRKIELEIYFQGEDHLDQALAFETSSKDQRAWVLSHPMYGNMTVQPLGLVFDNTKYNTSKITGTVIETITDDAPKVGVSPIDKITEDKANCDIIFAENYANSVVPDATDINDANSNVNSIYTKGAKVAKVPDSEKYYELFASAKADILNLTDDPLKAIQSIQAMIAAPALFATDITTRLNLLIDQFAGLRATIFNIFSPNTKRLYENNGAAIISSMILMTANPIPEGRSETKEKEYSSRSRVIAIIEKILGQYNNYIADLDSLQTDNGGDLDSYIPDQAALMSLDDLVDYGISNLFNIALNAKQERVIFLEADSNVINLAHRFYGMDVQDTTIDEFIGNNNMGLNDLLQIKKGRKIIYYVG